MVSIPVPTRLPAPTPDDTEVFPVITSLLDEASEQAKCAAEMTALENELAQAKSQWEKVAKEIEERLGIVRARKEELEAARQKAVEPDPPTLSQSPEPTKEEDGMKKEIPPPTIPAVIIGTILFYIGFVVQFVNLVFAIQDEDHSAAGFMFCALFVPRVFQFWHVFAMHAVMKKPDGLREALFALFNLNRGINAVRLARGQSIDWTSYVTEMALNLTWAVLPGAAANLRVLLMLQDYEASLQVICLVGSLFLQCVMQPLATTRAWHFVRGPPGNFEKYRLWEQPSAGPLTRLHFFAVRIIDFTMCSSTVVGVSLGFCFGGPVFTLLIFVVKMFAHYTWRMTSVQFMPLKPSDQRMMCIVIAAGEMVAARWHELIVHWNSPWYFHVHVILHGCIGLAIGSNWQLHRDNEWDEVVMSVFIGLCALNNALVVILYPYYVFIVRKKEVQHCMLKRAEFMKTLLTKNIDKLKMDLDL